MKKNIFMLMLSVVAISNALSATECCKNQDLCCNGVTTSNNTFLPRSFSSNSSREILMTKSMYEECRDSRRDAWHGTFTTATEFSSTMHRCDAAENLGTRPFWSGRNTMTYGTNDGQSDVDAWQFGMGNLDSVGTIKLDPHVQQAGVDMMLHFVQHLDRPGFYFKLRAPMGGMMIDPRMSEPVEAYADDATNLALDNTPTTPSPWPQYPGPDNRPRTLAAAFAGGRCDSANLAVANAQDFRANFAREIILEYGQISTCKMTAFRMADVSFAVGANLARCEKGLLGVGFKVAAPTGNTPKCEEILEPIFGRGGHWAIGFESFGYRKLHEGHDSFFSVRYQGELFHLRHGRTSFRSFDLKLNGPGSKYMLLEHYHQQPDGTFLPSHLITQAINLTTLPVRSTFNLEGSLAVMLDGGKGNWEYGVGAEMWARSCEKISVDCCEAIKDHFTGEFNDFAVLGRQRSGLDTNSGALPINNLCEPLATINKSEDGLEAAIASETAKIKDATQKENRIPAAICDALDFNSVIAKRALTGKLFGNIGYCWKDSNYKPHVSVYGAAEFATGSDNNAMNMWTVGVQGSLNF